MRLKTFAGVLLAFLLVFAGAHASDTDCSDGPCEKCTDGICATVEVATGNLPEITSCESGICMTAELDQGNLPEVMGCESGICMTAELDQGNLPLVSGCESGICLTGQLCTGTLDEISSCESGICITAEGDWPIAYECPPAWAKPPPPEPCVSTETPETTCDDGEDNDCDTLIDCEDTEDCCASPACIGEPACSAPAECDNDSDGFDSESAGCGGNDCDDSDPNTYPGAVEICDLKDNDCDGEIDEGCLTGVSSITGLTATTPKVGESTSATIELTIAEDPGEAELTLRLYMDDTPIGLPISETVAGPGAVIKNYELGTDGEIDKTGTYKVVATIGQPCSTCTKSAYFTVMEGLQAISVPDLPPLFAALAAFAALLVVSFAGRK